MPLPILAAGLPVAALWFALTAATGKTYHLAPVVAAAVPGALAAARAGVPERARRARPGAAWLAAIAGAVAVVAGWLAIVAAGIEPSATLAQGQPGGVLGEVVVGGLAGSAVGAAFVARARI